MLTTLTLRRCIVIAVVISVSACSGSDPGAQPQTSSARAALTTSDVGAKLQAFFLEVPSRTPSDIGARLRKLSSILTGRDLSDVSFVKLATAVNAAGPARMLQGVDDQPGLSVGYDPNGDQAWAADEAIMNIRMTGVDIGQSAATDAFRTVFQNLVNAGLLDGRHLDSTKAHVSYIMDGTGQVGTTYAVEAINQYIFHVPQTVNGIPVAHPGNAAQKSGVTIGVHRSGAIAHIKISGVNVHSSQTAGVDTPWSDGYVLTRNVTHSSLLKDLQAQYPSATIFEHGLQYRLVGGAAAAVEPADVFSVSVTSEINGHTIHGRRQYFYYSVKDPTASPVIWPIPNPNPQGPKRQSGESTTTPN